MTKEGTRAETDEQKLRIRILQHDNTNLKVKMSIFSSTHLHSIGTNSPEGTKYPKSLNFSKNQNNIEEVALYKTKERHKSLQNKTTKTKITNQKQFPLFLSATSCTCEVVEVPT